jgi:hypothetical protein
MFDESKKLEIINKLEKIEKLKVQYEEAVNAFDEKITLFEKASKASIDIDKPKPTSPKI